MGSLSRHAAPAFIAAALAIAGSLFPVARIASPAWAIVLGDGALLSAFVPLGWMMIRDGFTAPRPEIGDRRSSFSYQSNQVAGRASTSS